MHGTVDFSEIFFQKTFFQKIFFRVKYDQLEFFRNGSSEIVLQISNIEFISSDKHLQIIITLIASFLQSRYFRANLNASLQI